MSRDEMLFVMDIDDSATDSAPADESAEAAEQPPLEEQLESPQGKKKKKKFSRVPIDAMSPAIPASPSSLLGIMQEQKEHKQSPWAAVSPPASVERKPWLHSSPLGPGLALSPPARAPAMSPPAGHLATSPMDIPIHVVQVSSRGSRRLRVLSRSTRLRALDVPAC